MKSHFIKGQLLKGLAATALGLVLIASAGASFAGGGNLAPGTTITPANQGAGFTFSPLVSETTAFASPTGSYTGDLFSAVVNEGAANPLGGLTFVYGVLNNSSSRVSLGALAVNNFLGLSTSAFYDSLPGGSIAPSGSHRTLDGDTVKFYFLDGNGNETLAPGAESYLAIVQTSAHGYTQTLDGVQDGVETNARAYAPAPVPEASSLVSFVVLLLLGLGKAVQNARSQNSRKQAV